jgi:hypothetical protein
MAPNSLKDFKFWTVQTDTYKGLEHYKTYYTKRYAEKVYKEQCERIDSLPYGGAVTMFENHSFIKEYYNQK